jgi:hypothetical protein
MKIRIALLLAALGFSALVIYQNMAYFITPAKLQVNFWVVSPFYAEGIINAQIILGAFFIGLLIAYFWSLSSRYKNTQMVKKLNETLNSQTETISALKRELSQSQGAVAQQNPPQSEVPAENA